MPSLAGLPDVPCARCGKRARIEWGELCPICLGQRMERASKLSSWIAIVAALLAGIYAYLRIARPEQRYYAAIAVIAVYLITRRLATRLAMEFLPRDWEPGKPKESP